MNACAICFRNWPWKSFIGACDVHGTNSVHCISGIVIDVNSYVPLLLRIFDSNCTHCYLLEFINLVLNMNKN